MRNKLIELRTNTGLSRNDFALKVGCSFQHISQMEKGESPVTFKTLSKYAKVFGWTYSITLHCG